MQFNPVQTFLHEAEELLAEIEQSALALGKGERSEEIIHKLFRAFHTIKGSGAMCGLDSVAAFTHHLESLLDKVRNGEAPVTPGLADLILKAADHIGVLLAAEQDGPVPAPESGASLIAAMEELAGMGRKPAGDAAVAPAPARSLPEGAAQTWRIRFRPEKALLTCGGNPAALWQELRNLGACELIAQTDEVPTLDAIQPELCYVGWTAMLTTPADENTIRDVFIFVEDGSTLEIERAVEARAETPGPRTETRTETAPANAVQPRKPAAAGKESTVRVPSERLDRLVNLVGELVMNQSRLAQAVSQNGAPEFANPVQELERLVAELRDDVLGIRMLPIGTLFGRFRRLVHDLSAELGKETDMVTEGEETELDKSILDQLGEPLVHCLRNCLDHGIESPEHRAERGKPRRATVRLSAVHTGANVVIIVEDDGRGINREAVRAKAIEKQLIAPDAKLSDKEIFNLILLPGFSTASQVTSVSGRGVGMDAIKRQIDVLRGSLSIASEAGAGTRVAITLPLTLAIIDGLRVQIGDQPFIVPMGVVTENVELSRGERARNNGRNVIAVRGELVPYIDLREVFGVDGEIPAIEKVVIVQHEGDRVGFVVDRVLGTHQTVIQPLGRFLKNVEVVSGATIMGDGRVALILDPARVIRFADQRCRQKAA